MFIYEVKLKRQIYQIVPFFSHTLIYECPKPKKVSKKL